MKELDADRLIQDSAAIGRLFPGGDPRTRPTFGEQPQRQPRRPGLATRSLARLRSRPATVTGLEVLSPHFRLIDLASDALKGARPAPGQTITLFVSAGVAAQRFVPLAWDAERGQARILAFVGAGPWRCDQLDPIGMGSAYRLVRSWRPSIITRRRRPALLFGDETSIGLAVMLARYAPPAPQLLLEVSDAAEVRAVLRRFGLKVHALIERRAEEGHMPDIGCRLSGLIEWDATVLLCGRAEAVRHVGCMLEGVGVRRSRQRVAPS